MKLPDLLKALRSKHGFAELCHILEIDLDQEEEEGAVLIYFVDKFDLNSDVRLFSETETDDLLVYEKNGVSFFQLANVFLIKHLIENDFKEVEDFNLLASAVFSYVKYDA
jgi:hypothetical protein